MDKKIVLVVEHASLVLRTLSDKLRFEGMTVLEAKNGKEGFSLALTGHPDLILLDFHLPKMESMNLMRKLKADRSCEEIPIITLTNYEINDQNMLKSITNKFTEHLIGANTPIEMLLQKIHEVLDAEKKI